MAPFLMTRLRRHEKGGKEEGHGCILKKTKAEFRILGGESAEWWKWVSKKWRLYQDLNTKSQKLTGSAETAGTNPERHHQFIDVTWQKPERVGIEKFTKSQSKTKPHKKIVLFSRIIPMWRSVGRQVVQERRICGSVTFLLLFTGTTDGWNGDAGVIIDIGRDALPSNCGTRTGFCLKDSRFQIPDGNLESPSKKEGRRRRL